MSLTLYPTKPAPGSTVDLGDGRTVRRSSDLFLARAHGATLAAPSYGEALSIATDQLSGILAALPDRARPQPATGYRGDPREYPGYGPFVARLSALSDRELAALEEEINRLKATPHVRAARHRADLATDAWTLTQWAWDARNRAAAASVVIGRA